MAFSWPTGLSAASNVSKVGISKLTDSSITAPSITQQPSSQLVLVGQPAYFTLTTDGSLPQTYQWYKDGNALSGATSPVLSFSAATSNDAGSYWVAVSNNPSSSVTSDHVSLAVGPAIAPTILAQPTSTTNVQYGESFYLSGSVSGSTPIAYQWYLNGAPIPEATSSVYYSVASTTAATGTYTVTAINAAGSVTSSNAIATVAAPIAPTISQQPIGQIATNTALNCTFWVSASGTLPISYQWYKDNVAIAGATNGQLLFPQVKSADAGTYTVVVANAGGSVTSNGAILTVDPTPPPDNSSFNLNPPLITYVQLGGQFNASAPNVNVVNNSQFASLPGIYYQWFKNGVAIPNATNSFFSISGVKSTDVGDYFATISTAGGTITGPTTTLVTQTTAYPNNQNSWLDAEVQGNVIYFIFTSPAEIRRYDLSSGAWLSPVSLTQTPTAMRTATEGVYVAFGRTVGLYSLDLSTSTSIASTAASTTAIFLNPTYVYLSGSSGGGVTAVKRSGGGTPVITDGQGNDFSNQVSVSPFTNIAYALSGSELITLTLNSDGTVSTNIPHFTPNATNGNATVLSPDGALAIGNNGTIYNATDLSYHASLVLGSFDDLCFLSDGRPVALRGSQLQIYDASAFNPLGTVTMTSGALKLFQHGSAVVAFAPPATSGGSIGVTSVTEAQLLANPPSPAPAISAAAASALSFVPDDAVMDKNGLVYLMDRFAQNLLIWSSSQKKYLNSIPLVGIPDKMTYSATLHRIYISFADRRVTYIDLGSSPSEVPFTTVSSSILGLVAVDNQLYIHLSDGTDSGDYRALYSSSGQRVASTNGGTYYSLLSYWNSQKQALYENIFGQLVIAPVNTGSFGTEIDNYSGVSLSPTFGPVRFSADGSLLVSGAGTIYNATDFSSAGTLGTSLIDAAWQGTAVSSLSLTGAGSQIQNWSGSGYLLTWTAPLTGYPQRLWALPGNQLLALTISGAGPIFTILDSSGNQISQFSNAGTPNVPPFITNFTVPNLNFDPGDSTTLSVMATGTNLNYQWQYNSVALPGATAPSLTLHNLQNSDSGAYSVVVSDGEGSATSPVANVYVDAQAQPPQILTFSGDQSAVTGQTPSFSVTASGTNLTYQWLLNNVPVAGATGPSINVPAATPDSDGLYTVIVTGSNGGSSSDAGNLTVVLAPPDYSANPVISSQPPARQFAVPGGSTSLTVGATGVGVTYQWRFNGVAITGATSPTLVLSNISTLQSGDYVAAITMGSNTILSSKATVTVNSGAWLTNISARAFVAPAQNAADVLIAGFVTVGSSTKQVLIRGSGPALQPLGIATGFLPNPSLTVYTGPNPGPTVTTWDASLSSVFTRLGAFPFTEGTNDTATLQTFNPGAYTAIIGSADGKQSGIALAELYDADQGAPTNRLVNISARAYTGTGANVLIGGFVVEGTSSETVLIRAVGPGLQPAGLASSILLAKPSLQVFDSNPTQLASGPQPIASIQGWNTAPTKGTSTVSAGIQLADTTVMTRVGASSLTTGSADSAMVLTLPPGAYTAVVSGADGGAGVALVEIYEVQ